MSWVLFISPGIGANDAARAKARYEGMDDDGDQLDQERIRTVAAELMREFRMKIGSEDDEADGSPRGVDLELEGDDLGADIRVDASGVAVAAYRVEPDVKQAIAMARAASRLLGGAVYEASGRRIVTTIDGDADLIAAATEAISPPVSAADRAAANRGMRGMFVLSAVMVVVFVAAHQLLPGFPFFTPILFAVCAGFCFLVWRVRGPGRAALSKAPGAGAPPAAAPGPPRHDAGIDNTPLKPG